MLWSKRNSILQFIYWANIYILKVTDGTPDECVKSVKRHQKDVIDIVLVSLLTWHTFTSCPDVFSVSIVDVEQAKSWLSSKSYCSEKHDVTFMLFVRNFWFIIVRGELRTYSTYKLGLFPKLVYSLKSLTILIRSSILWSITGCWICLGYFFRFSFYLQFFYWLLY